MKQQFIQSLKNEQVLYSDNQRELAYLPDDVFEPFNAILVTLDTHEHRWNRTYFNEKKIDLNVNFSKELVEHLIAVKKQYQGEQSASHTPITPIVLSQNQDIEHQTHTSTDTHHTTPPEISVDLANFQPRENLLTHLQAGDMDNTRSYLMSMLNNRRLTLEELFKSIWYVHQYHGDVFEPEEEENAFIQAMSYDENTWNNEYFNLQQVYLNRNFTLARLLHLSNVRETLMKRGDKHFQQIEVKKSNDAPTLTQDKSVIDSHKEQDLPKTHSTQKSEYRSQSEQSYTHQNNANNISSDKNKSFIKTLLMVGGAVLAAGIVIFAVLK